MDRRVIVIGGIALALLALSLVGWTPQVLYRRALETFADANGAASKAQELSNKRQKHFNQATGVLDDLPGPKKDSWTDRN